MVEQRSVSDIDLNLTSKSNVRSQISQESRQLSEQSHPYIFDWWEC